MPLARTALQAFFQYVKALCNMGAIRIVPLRRAINPDGTSTELYPVLQRQEKIGGGIDLQPFYSLRSEPRSVCVADDESECPISLPR